MKKGNIGIILKSAAENLIIANTPLSGVYNTYTQAKAERNMNEFKRNIENRIIPKSLNHTINRNLKIIAKLAQINKTLIHHMARHTCATTVLLENGVTIEEVKEWLGHVDISSTMVYAKVTSTQKRKTLDRVYETSNSLFKYNLLLLY